MENIELKTSDQTLTYIIYFEELLKSVPIYTMYIPFRDDFQKLFKMNEILSFSLDLHLTLEGKIHSNKNLLEVILYPVQPDQLVRHRVGFDVTLKIDIISSSQIVRIQRFPESQ